MAEYGASRPAFQVATRAREWTGFENEGLVVFIPQSLSSYLSFVRGIIAIRLVPVYLRGPICFCLERKQLPNV